MARRRNPRDTSKFQEVFDWIIIDQWRVKKLAGLKAAHTLNDWLKQYGVDDASIAKKIVEETWDGKLDY